MPCSFGLADAGWTEQAGRPLPVSGRTALQWVGCAFSYPPHRRSLPRLPPMPSASQTPFLPQLDTGFLPRLDGGGCQLGSHSDLPSTGDAIAEKTVLRDLNLLVPKGCAFSNAGGCGDSVRGLQGEQFPVNRRAISDPLDSSERVPEILGEGTVRRASLGRMCWRRAQIWKIGRKE